MNLRPNPRLLLALLVACGESQLDEVTPLEEPDMEIPAAVVNVRPPPRCSASGSEREILTHAAGDSFSLALDGDRVIIGVSEDVSFTGRVPTSSVYRARVSGGEAERLTLRDYVGGPIRPFGDKLVFQPGLARKTASGWSFQYGAVVLEDLGTGERETIGPDASSFAVTPAGVFWMAPDTGARRTTTVWRRDSDGASSRLTARAGDTWVADDTELVYARGPYLRRGGVIEAASLTGGRARVVVEHERDAVRLEPRGVDASSVYVQEIHEPGSRVVRNGRLLAFERDGTAERIVVDREAIGAFAFGPDHVYFSDSGGLFRVPKRGGSPERIWTSTSAVLRSVTADACNVVWATSSASIGTVYVKSH